ncbi:MAG TPA: response regulator, partial [Caldithrix sp.]|nr:response regulator [Caldithrix sp.]
LKSGEHDQAFYRELWETIAGGNTWRGILINRRKDGSTYFEDAIIAPVKDESGKIINYAGMKRDITREKKLEDQLRQAQKMEAIGRLAGGVAHDFNNLLTVINGYSELLLRKLEPAAPFHKEITQISKAGERASHLTDQLLAFSRRQVIQPKVLNLNLVVADSVKMLRRLIGEDIDLATVLDPDLGNVKVDPGQMEQIILNLAVNARDAMPQGGKLTIETSNFEIDDRYLKEHVEIQKGWYVMLAVSDTGIGMSKEIQNHIFEPFFTTKEHGKGTGLGLSTVYGIVKQNNGYVWVYSEPGEGTTFKIYLPVIKEAVSVSNEPDISLDALRGEETVLLVEDERNVRRLAKRILSENGYSVLEAEDGFQALQVSRKHKGKIHLLLTDVVMPSMSGKELAEKMEILYRGIKVVCFSGYTDNAIMYHRVLEPGTAFIQKPFTPLHLLKKIREVLDRE